MKSYRTIESEFNLALAVAREAAQQRATGETTVERFGQTEKVFVTWGATVDTDWKLVVEIEVRRETQYGMMICNRKGYWPGGDNLPREFRENLARGQKRLEDWQRGGEFPTTVEALFAPLEGESK